MPDGSANPGAHIHFRDLFALLFAALCGLLLGVAAAPTVLPMLGFAGFANYVEPRESLGSGPAARGNHQPLATHAISAARPSRLANNRPPSSHALPRPSVANRSRLVNERVHAATNAGAASTSPLFAWFDNRTLFALAVLALGVVVWLRRDLFAMLLCRWAKDPSQWRGVPAAGLVNAKCVLYFEGNAYRLGAEFFAQAVEVRYSPLFVRINMRGSNRAIVVPRRLPHIAARGSLKRQAAS
jgi:hypothetical protein